MNLEVNKYTAQFTGREFLDRIAASKIRWEKILKGEDLNDYDCVLSTSIFSKTHNHPSYPFPSIRCKLCLIREATGDYNCRNTPFGVWRLHHYEEHNNSRTTECPVCAEIIKDICLFLTQVEELYWESLFLSSNQK